MLDSGRSSSRALTTVANAIDLRTKGPNWVKVIPGLVAANN